MLTLFVAVYCGNSQGTVAFQNRNAAVNIDAPVSYASLPNRPDGRIDGGGSGAAAMAGLFAGPDGATEDQLVLIAPAVNFRSGTAAGYVNVGTSASRTIPGVPAGAFAMVQIRVWDNGAPGASYEEVVNSGTGYLGKSNILRLATGGAGQPPGPAANMVGLQAFSVTIVPEPGTITMAILAASGALFLIRRRK